MNKTRLLLSVLFFANIITNAQSKKDPVLLTVAGDKIPRSEFEKIYRKNNNKESVIDKKSIADYLELYINYKLKVKEAEELKLDTSKSFKDELSGYRKQLAQPYLTDKTVSDQLIKEAYDRLKTDVHASHILIRVNPDALPKDTLEAYNKTLKIRDRIIKGEDFGKVAQEVSEDPSAKENKGDLGFFTSMQMVYTFESAAYTAKPNQVTMPVRTRFGYHLIKVIETRPAKGEIHVAHIMVKCPADATKEDSLKAKTKIDEIYKKIQDGGNFEELAKQYSDDVNSGRSGGALPWFGTGRMVPDFENAAFALSKDGEISKPVKSPYGWHIIKRLEKKDLASFAEMQSEIKSKVSKDSRSEVGKISLIKRIKKDYGFKEFSSAKAELINALDSTLAQGKFEASSVKKYNKPLFKLQDKTFTQSDFSKYLEEHQVHKQGVKSQAIATGLYDQFVNESCLTYEENNLDKKYPEFKSLMQEYRDGILLFELTDRKVWSKAVKDSSGLKSFYEKNKEKYMWGERTEATIYTCSNQDVANQVKSLIGKIPNDSLMNKINKTSQLNLNVKEGKFSKGENDVLDSLKLQKGMSPEIHKNNSVILVNVKEIIPPQPKSLEEAKGIVTADYQNYLEKEWIATLRNKYPVVVNKEVLSNIVQ